MMMPPLRPELLRSKMELKNHKMLKKSQLISLVPKKITRASRLLTSPPKIRSITGKK